MRTQWTAKGNRDAGSSCLCDRGLHRYLWNFGGGGGFEHPKPLGTPLPHTLHFWTHGRSPLCRPNRWILTFRGPCIVTYSCNESQPDALLLNFILVKSSTCFGQIYCPSSGVSTLYTAIGICHASYVACLLAVSQHNQYDKHLLLCIVLSLLMMDSKSVRNM